MSQSSSGTLWDNKYRQGLPSLTMPDPFFVSAYSEFVAQRFPVPGDALDIAGGLGRHALWLARRAWRVSVVDVSEVALAKLARKAARQALDVRLVAGDAASFEFEPQRYDLLVLFYHFDRTLCPKLVQALRPGGLIVTKLALEWTTRSSTRRAPDSPPTRGELPTLLSGVQVLHHAERPVGHRGVVEFVGQK